MNNLLTRLITVRYYIALGLIGVFVTASFLLLDHAINLQPTHSRFVDMAADQRVAGQRIGFLAAALANARDEESRQLFRDSLRRTVEEMTERHRILSLRKDADRIPSGMRTVLRKVHYEGGEPFDPKMRNFLDNARKLYDERNDSSGDGLHTSLNIGEVDDILQSHQIIARLLRIEDHASVNQIHRLGILLWALTLVLLAVEVPLIFRPMAQRAAANLDRIDRARRTAEREAAAAEAAREGQASFIRTMSHELRTPLNAIMGMAQLMKLSGVTKKQNEYAEDIIQAGGHLLELIDGILEFSRLEAGQVEIRKAPMSIEDELKRTLSLFRPLVSKKGLELHLYADAGFADRYRADAPRIRQVLVNMVGNAIKFTSDGSITVRAIRTGPAGPVADLVRFEVEDTGIGVPNYRREHIFEEFQQADTSLSRKYGGSGLGLAICRRLVQLMGGEIGVESTEGKGSLFWFSLPLEREVSPMPRTGARGPVQL